MRKMVAAVVLGISLGPWAVGDTVWLKNGTAVKVNKATIKGDQLEYIVGATTYRIPMVQVDHVERTQTFGVAVSVVGPNAGASAGGFGEPIRDSDSGSAPVERRAPIRSAGLRVSNSENVLKRILIYDRIDDRALGQIEGEGNRGYSAAAYAVASNYEYSTNKDSERARKYGNRAIEFSPDNVALLCWQSSLLMEAGEYGEAATLAERAISISPESADALFTVGAVYYATNRLPEAIAAWKHGLRIRPDETVTRYVAKAEREVAVEGNFHERESSHFRLKFEGQRTGFSMAGEILSLLERQYGELSRELGISPQSQVTVVLYTEKEFFDVTQSPSWAGGLNDGKVRIPVRNVSSISGAFERVLKHELAHSFIHSITRGNSAGWIDEGLAQLVEPRDASAYGRWLAGREKQGRQLLPLQALEPSFVRFNDQQADIAYAEALVTVDYIRSARGMSALTRMLEYLGSGASPEEALRQATGAGYAQFERDLNAALKAQN